MYRTNFDACRDHRGMWGILTITCDTIEAQQHLVARLEAVRLTNRPQLPSMRLNDGHTFALACLEGATLRDVTLLPNVQICLYPDDLPQALACLN